MKKQRETWIINGSVVTQDEERRVLRSNLRIVDGRIAEITKKKPGRASKNIQILDAHGLTILPGFVQAHVHLCQTLFRNLADDMELLDWLSKRIWVYEAAHTPQTLKVSALLGIHEMLSSGTTCILDMGTVRHTKVIFEAIRDSGIRANVGKCLMDRPENPKDLQEPTEAAIKEAVALFKHWNGAENDRIRASYAPRFVISCTEKLLREVGAAAKKDNAIIHTHASENRTEIEIVKKLVGQENVEYLHHLGLTSPNLVLAHCIWLKENEIEILRQTGTHAVHCPSSNLKLASGIARVPELRQKGVNVALGPDGAPCNNNLNMFTEMRLAALIHKPGNGPRSMNAQDVLDMATRDGAKALGWFQDIGSIEIGKKADIIGLDLSGPENFAAGTDRESLVSSIVYSTQNSHLRWTMVDGRILYKNGKVLTIPRDRLMSQVRAAQRKIIKTTT